MRKSTRLRFDNGRGDTLAGIIDSPPSPRCFALFSHCFTCTKDLKAIVRISRRLAEQGIAVLRFDFTGLGESDGTFAATDFRTNCRDIQAAAEFLARQYSPPALLIGHSLGGAAALMTAPQLPSVRAVATIAAPSDTVHLAQYLADRNPAIDSEGSGLVTIGGLDHRISRAMLETLRSVDLPKELARVETPLLILHSPVDETLSWQHAEALFHQTAGPRSLVMLDGADHLLVRQPTDVQFVADLIAVWSRRFIDSAPILR